jgi:hypothetical protein
MTGAFFRGIGFQPVMSRITTSANAALLYVARFHDRLEAYPAARHDRLEACPTAAAESRPLFCSHPSAFGLCSSSILGGLPLLFDVMIRICLE